MTTNTSLVKGKLLSLTLSAWMFLTTMLTFQRKSKPQYVGPKVVAIDSYSRPTMRRTSDRSGSFLPPSNTQAMLNRMEPELSGATEDRDTGWVPSPSQPWPWLPKPQPAQKIAGLQNVYVAVESGQATHHFIPYPDGVEIIPGLTI